MGVKNGKHGFEQYEAACDEVWTYKLQVSFAVIKRQVYSHCEKMLLTPNFHINPRETYQSLRNIPVGE